MRQPRISGAHGGDQRVDDLALNPVRQVTLVGDIGKAAPAVGNFLVLGESVGDQRELLHVVLERFRKRLGGSLALFSGAILQQVESRFDRERLSLNLEPQIGDRRVELPIPGGKGRHRFFVKELLDAIFQLIGPVAAHVLDPRPIVAERRIASSPPRSAHRRCD